MTKLCLKMRPYLALEDDIIVKEGEVGEEMYMVVRGTIKLQSDTWRQYNERNWVDGAFFGELTVLGIGAGSEDEEPTAHEVLQAAAAFDLKLGLTEGADAFPLVDGGAQSTVRDDALPPGWSG